MRYFLCLVVCMITGFAHANPVFALEKDDLDGDGISDSMEWTVYYTDPMNPDTDGDGYIDGIETQNGYSPIVKDKKRNADVDTDKDGLSDALEFQFKTDIKNPDTDGDGFLDGNEIKNGYSPLSIKPEKWEKKIEVNLKKQRLHYSIHGVELGTMVISTGKAAMPTPKGEFRILNKTKRAWSKSANLWMPYWMAFAGGGKYGIHELPEWPNGKKEGVNHLGRPVSHGCIRLSEQHAKFLYEWAPIGTKVAVKDS